ncbi:hypothetical protein [Arthrobacter sp.]|uniref:hypothetical protein n=1 Tax=Arthrobacter sp. TaxID=1667 RepID=UPI0039C8833E
MPWHNNGPTTQTNGAGLCEACNHTHRPHLPLHRTTATRKRASRNRLAESEIG